MNISSYEQPSSAEVLELLSPSSRSPVRLGRLCFRFQTLNVALSEIIVCSKRSKTTFSVYWYAFVIFPEIFPNGNSLWKFFPELTHDTKTLVSSPRTVH